jgi:hypothetical protein
MLIHIEDMNFSANGFCSDNIVTLRHVSRFVHFSIMHELLIKTHFFLSLRHLFLISPGLRCLKWPIHAMQL